MSNNNSNNNNSGKNCSGTAGTTTTTNNGFTTINTANSWWNGSATITDLYTTEEEYDELDINNWEVYREQKEQAKVKCGNAEGYECIKCNDFYPMAEINMPNKTFECYSCRKGLFSIK